MSAQSSSTTNDSPPAASTDPSAPVVSAPAAHGTSEGHGLSAMLSAGDDHDADIVPETLALMIPIVAIVLALSTTMMKQWLDYRRKREAFQLHHAERMAAIEKGIDVPPLPPEFFQESRSKHQPTDNLRSGLTLLMVGIAVVIAMRAMNDGAADNAWWGLIIVGIGLAKLIFYFITARKPPQLS